MWPHGTWGCPPPLLWMFPLIFLIALALMLFFLLRRTDWLKVRGRRMRGQEGSARKILDRRYARGEIGQEEYQRIRRDLE